MEKDLCNWVKESRKEENKRIDHLRYKVAFRNFLEANSILETLQKMSVLIVDWKPAFLVGARITILCLFIFILCWFFFPPKISERVEPPLKGNKAAAVTRDLFLLLF